MKRGVSISTVAMILFVLFVEFSCAGDLSEKVSGIIRERIETAEVTSDYIVCSYEAYCRSPLLLSFYTARQFQPLWLDEEGNPLFHAEDFLDILRDAHCDGLRPGDYHLGEIEALLSEGKKRIGGGGSREPTILADFDLTLTDALLLYTHHVLHGRAEHLNVSPGEVIAGQTTEAALKLYTDLASGAMKGTLADLVNRDYGYKELREKLWEYQNIAERGGWPLIPQGPTLKKGSHGERVTLLRKRLSLSGDLDELNGDKTGVFDHELEEAVKRFQRRHGIKVDGMVTKDTLDVLNVPVEKRIRQIALNLDRLRRLPNDLGKSYIIVNIADFRLDVFEENRPVMTMKIIVGKKDQPSCMLSGKIVYMELNPFWKIPDGIAVKEILPQIKKNPEYLAEKDIKLLWDWNDNAKEIDPKTVDWSRIREHNFRYKLRQDPGPRNPLGRIKFIFPNECEIYLHDTPGRSLFGKPRRAFSHGCIRIEKPVELATYLLRESRGWTRKKILTEIGRGKRQVVTLQKPFDVHIGYFTAWVDHQGLLQFRNDLYHLDEVPYELPERENVRLTYSPSVSPP